MAREPNQEPEAVGKQDRTERKLTWETPQVIAAAVYLTEASASAGTDATVHKS